MTVDGSDMFEVVRGPEGPMVELVGTTRRRGGLNGRTEPPSPNRSRPARVPLAPPAIRPTGPMPYGAEA